MTPGRDYSDVVWPWDDDPNWGPPRERATSDGGDGENWRLACVDCGLYFPKDIEMHVVVAHIETQHGLVLNAAGDPVVHLDFVWVGLGAPPIPET